MKFHYRKGRMVGLRNKPQFISILLLSILLSACGMSSGNSGYVQNPASQITSTLLNSVPTSQPTEILSEKTMEAPLIELRSTPTLCRASTDFNSLVLSDIGTSTDSCLPEDTNEGIGIFIYDLDNQRELVSINADIPFQFGSAFKAPLLVYFLSSCRQYWDVNSSIWQDQFLQQKESNDQSWYSSQEYEQLLKEFFSDIHNWGEIQSFTDQNLIQYNDKVTSVDRRYDILEQVYRMVTESNNIAAGNVLNFIIENCKDTQPHEIEQKCGGSNAITEFNYWFNNFSNIEYLDNEMHRGLHSWDTITIVDGNGIKSETRMPTYAIEDSCALQGAFIGCSNSTYVNNAWTARDLFGFYRSLYFLDDESVRTTAFDILKVDIQGNSRGYFKNLSRKLGTVSISKNGFDGYLLVDAGIINVYDKDFIVVTMSYNALNSMNELYGQYDNSGEPSNGFNGLIEDILRQESDICSN